MENGERDIVTPSPGLSIPNVGEGDYKITFDKDKPGECERAASMVKEMLLRGFAIVVRLDDGSYKKIKRFDPNTYEYIVSDMPKESASSRKAESRLPAATTSAVAIARSARGCAREAW